LLNREQYYLDKLKPYKRGIGFNIGIFAHSPPKGRKASAETREKLSAIRRGKPVPWLQTPEVKAKANKGKASPQRRAPSAESRKRQGESARGWHHTPEARQRIGEESIRRERPARHIVTMPDGTELLVQLSSFCREHGLNYRSMKMIARRSNHRHKGYAVRRITSD
jgi:hypothetical protein